MLGTQILEGLLGWSNERCRTDQECVLRGNEDPKFLLIGYHVKNVFSDNRRLPNDADSRRALSQDESRDIMILLNHPAISCSSGGNKIHGRLNGSHGIDLFVVGCQQVRLIRFEFREDLFLLDGCSSLDGDTPRRLQGKYRQQQDPDSRVFTQWFLLPQ